MTRKFQISSVIAVTLLTAAPVQALADGVKAKPFFSVSRGDTDPVYEEGEALRSSVRSGAGAMKVSRGDTDPAYEEGEALRQNVSAGKASFIHVALNKVFGMGKALQASLFSSAGPQSAMVSTRSVKVPAGLGAATSASSPVSGSSAFSAR